MLHRREVLRVIFVLIAVVLLILSGVLESTGFFCLAQNSAIPKFGYIDVALMHLFGLDSALSNVFSLPGTIWWHSVESGSARFSVLIRNSVAMIALPALNP